MPIAVGVGAASGRADGIKSIRHPSAVLARAFHVDNFTAFVSSSTCNHFLLLSYTQTLHVDRLVPVHFSLRLFLPSFRCLLFAFLSSTNTFSFHVNRPSATTYQLTTKDGQCYCFVVSSGQTVVTQHYRLFICQASQAVIDQA
jgi:hypothetical protein